MTREIAATPSQLLRGTPITTGGRTECTDCARTLREGDRVGVYAVRPHDERAFEIPRIYCRGCRPAELSHPTLGARELLARARLAVTSDDATREARLTLRDPEPVAHAPADDGVEPDADG